MRELAVRRRSVIELPRSTGCFILRELAIVGRRGATVIGARADKAVDFRAIPVPYHQARHYRTPPAYRHRTNTLQKLGLRDCLALTRYAIRVGLIEPSAAISLMAQCLSPGGHGQVLGRRLPRVSRWCDQCGHRWASTVRSSAPRSPPPDQYIGPVPSDSSRRSRATPCALTGRGASRRDATWSFKPTAAATPDRSIGIRADVGGRRD
jgi:hypothetical protein